MFSPPYNPQPSTLNPPLETRKPNPATLHANAAPGNRALPRITYGTGGNAAGAEALGGGPRRPRRLLDRQRCAFFLFIFSHLALALGPGVKAHTPLV